MNLLSVSVISLHANMERSSSSAKVAFVLSLFMKCMDHYSS